MRSPIGLALLLFSMAAQAAPVTWHLQDVVFDDGATASGSFVYDADTGNYSSIDITTTDSGSTTDSSAAFQWNSDDFKWVELNAPGGGAMNGWRYADLTVDNEGWAYSFWDSSEISFPIDGSHLAFEGKFACDSYYFLGCDEAGSLPVMFWEFSNGLTNAGGTINVQSAAEFRCASGFGGCEFPSFGDSRSIVSGVITTVPIPAAAWLFGSALAGLSWLRRKESV